MHKKIYVVLFILCSGKVIAQQRDFASTSYTFVPSRLNQVDFNQSKTVVNIPFKTSIGMFSSSLSFDYYKFNYDTNLIAITQSLQRFYAVNYRLNYVRNISDKWKLGVSFMVGTQSNFEAKLSSEDFNLGGGLFFTKTTLKKNSRSQLVIGVIYTNALGEQRLLPMIGYAKQYVNGSSFSLGFPNTNYKHQINQKNSVKAFLGAEGFYMNIGDKPNFDGNSKISKASFLSGSLGLEYKHKVDDNWAVMLKTSYSFLNEYRLMDLQENEIFDFNLSPVLYISTGVTFNLNRKQNNLK